MIFFRDFPSIYPFFSSFLSYLTSDGVRLYPDDAWPISYYAMNKWLQSYAYRTNLELWTFILAAGLALIIAILTVSYQSFKAALTDPVKALRYE